jgi:hypothetical protein
LLVLEAVGVIVVKKRRKNRAATYRIVDMKQLMRDLGGELNKHLHSYLLPESQMTHLQEKVRQVNRASQRKRVAPLSDTLECSPLATRVDESDSGVALEGHPCRSIERHPLINKNQDFKTKTIHSFSTAQSGEQVQAEPEAATTTTANANAAGDDNTQSEGEGNGKDQSESDAGAVTVTPNADAVDLVMREWGITNQRTRRVYAEVITARTAESGHAPGRVATEMLQSWKNYNLWCNYLIHPWGRENFFSGGHWLNPASWRIDRRRHDTDSERRTGML